MVAGSCTWLRKSQSFLSHSYLSKTIHATCLCLFYTNMALWCIINKPRPLGMYLCLRLIWLWNLVARHWLTGPHSTPIPKSDQSHNIYLICFFILMNFCHLCLLEARLHACWNQAVRRDWPAWKTKIVEKQQDKSFFVEAQVLYSVAN